MAKTVISLADLLTASEPKRVLEDALIAILRKQLPKLGIIWNANAFRAGLKNPKLPKKLLQKLESLLEVAELSHWELSTEAVRELDEVVEDVESFNPAFLERMKRLIEQADRENAWIPLEQVEQELGLRK